jgi:hypothetical protein
MSTIIQSLHRDHRDVERLLGVLEHECDGFIARKGWITNSSGELIEHLDVFLQRYLLLRQDLIFKRVRRSDATCAKIVEEIADNGTKASANLKALSNTLRDVLNEQCVSRRIFDDVARTLH